MRQTEAAIRQMYLDAEISIEQLDHHKMAIRVIKARLAGRFPIGFNICNHEVCKYL